MIPPCSVIRWSIVCLQLLTVLTIAPGELLAIQIAPNPNPDVNTITITPSTPRENLVPFTNLGTINIEPLASFHNASQFDNSGLINNMGTITNSGRFTEIKRPFPFPGGGILLLPEGSQFHNLASGLYNSADVSTLINGTFVNEGAVDHILGHIVVEKSGQYIQRQAVGSSVTATTMTSDAPFRNAGRVRIAAGDFIINPIRLHSAIARYDQSATGTTQIDARFQNIGGQVWNAGGITIGATGEYRQQSPFPGGILAGSTTNSGTFTNAGTTNIATGVFTNQGSVANSGTFTVGAAGQYVQEVSSGSSQQPGTQNSGTFTNAGTVRIGEGTSFGNFSNRTPPVAQYIQQAGGTTHIDGTFQVGGAKVENAGSMTVGSTGTYHQAFNKFVPVVSTTVNSGTFANAGSTVINAGTFTNYGAVANSGTFQVGVVGPGAVINHGGVVNSGTFEVAARGQVTGTGTYVQTAAAAQTVVNGTFAHNLTLQAGALTGSGTIQGTVQNSGGLLLPGANGLGTLTIKGQYAQGFGGTFGVNLAGLSQGVTYGLLAVQGTGAAVTLGGSLKVGLLNGFSPSLGSTFGILTCTGCTISGGLRSLSLPALASGLDWSVGFVDGLGTLQLAVVSVPTASAPEPGTFLLVGVGFVALVGWRRRKIKARSAQTVVL